MVALPRSSAGVAKLRKEFAPRLRVGTSRVLAVERLTLLMMMSVIGPMKFRVIVRGTGRQRLMRKTITGRGTLSSTPTTAAP